MSAGPFPLEIIEQIVYYLTHDWDGRGGQKPRLSGTMRIWDRISGAAPYATVNKTWQVAVERETFSFLCLDLGRLAEADAILNKVPRRQKYVRTIRLNVSCATDHWDFGSYDQFIDHNNRVLQDTFEAFLETLSDWTPGPPLELCLDAFALTENGRREIPSDRIPTIGPIELPDPERVLRCGPVHVVTVVGMEPEEPGRTLSATAMCALVARLPAAKCVYMNSLGVGNHHYLQARNGFAQALKTVTHAMDDLFIAGGNFHPSSHPEPPRAPGQHKAEPDALSQVLGVMSLRLQSLDLYDVAISDELFLQHNLPAGMASPAHWARLENLSVYYPIVMASGESLFYWDPSIPDEEEPVIVADPAIQRRYLTAARAALDMPQLQNMVLVADLDFEEDWHKFWYCRNAEGDVPKAIWTSGFGFEPEEEVLEAWRDVARKHSGGTEELEVVISEIEDDV
ncbi:hypothetical protein GGR54DRAFT_611381 [Hypoxylon sp. NC1633]|nr:hypothetical protein GGR54DRAFT_611381 [Hypoxylon sp. NC1633]